MKKVIIESPYRGDVKKNCAYARACLSDSLERGESPFAGHLLYSQVLNYDIEEERHLGVDTSHTWGESAHLTAVYTDLGITKKMHIGIGEAKMLKREIEYRSLPNFEDGIVFKKLVDKTVEMDLAQCRGGNTTLFSFFYLIAIMQGWSQVEVKTVRDQINNLSLKSQYEVMSLYTVPKLLKSSYRNMVDVRFVLKQLTIHGSDLELVDMDEWNDAQWEEWRIIQNEMRNNFTESYGLFPDWVKPEEKYQFDPVRITSMSSEAIKLQRTEFKEHHIYMRWFPLDDSEPMPQKESSAS